VINFATVEPNKILMTINGLSDRFVLATSWCLTAWPNAERSLNTLISIVADSNCVGVDKLLTPTLWKLTKLWTQNATRGMRKFWRSVKRYFLPLNWYPKSCHRWLCLRAFSCVTDRCPCNGLCLVKCHLHLFFLYTDITLPYITPTPVPNLVKSVPRGATVLMCKINEKRILFI